MIENIVFSSWTSPEATNLKTKNSALFTTDLEKHSFRLAIFSECLDFKNAPF